MNRLSVQEIILGFLSTLILTIKLGWLGIALSAITAVLWVLGGTFKKSIRRYGVPITTLVFCTATLGFQWYYLLSLLGIVVLVQGDGFPDHRPTTEDEGSRLGRFVEKYINSNDAIGGPITKLIIVLLFQLSLIPYFIR